MQTWGNCRMVRVDDALAFPTQQCSTRRTSFWIFQESCSTAVSCSNRSTMSMHSEELKQATRVGLETGTCATGVPRKQRATHYDTQESHASGFWVVVVFDFLLTGTTRGLSTTAQGARIMFHLCAQNFAKIVDDIRQQT